MTPIIIGGAGVLILLLASVFSSDSTTASSDESNTVTYTVSQYTEQLESRLQKNICKIKGIRHCSVMITLKTTERHLYATEDKINEDEQKKQTEEEYVILNGGSGGDIALQESVVLPQINGVLVICDGASNIDVKSRVLEAVTTVLNVTSNRVCVLETN